MCMPRMLNGINVNAARALYWNLPDRSIKTKRETDKHVHEHISLIYLISLNLTLLPPSEADRSNCKTIVIPPLSLPPKSTAAPATMGDAEKPKEEEAKTVRAAPCMQPAPRASTGTLRRQRRSGHSPQWLRPKPTPAATLLTCPCLC